MADIFLELYDGSQFEEWEQFVLSANDGTLFHRLAFLSYHGDRFKSEAAHLIWRKSGAICSVMPLGIVRSDGHAIARSPIGASWGGIVQPRRLELSTALGVVRLLLDHLRARDVRCCSITTTPMCDHATYNNYTEFALVSAGFRTTVRELTSVVPLPAAPGQVWERLDRKSRNQTRSARERFQIRENATVEEFYPLLLEDKGRHDARPTHTLEELRWVADRLPESVRIDVAEDHTGPAAGICYFVMNPRTLVVFYLAQRNSAVGFNPVNALLVHGLERAVREGYRYVDLGTSSDHMQPHLGVCHFKEGFGAVGMFRDTLEWKNE